MPRRRLRGKLIGFHWTHSQVAAADGDAGRFSHALTAHVTRDSDPFIRSLFGFYLCFKAWIKCLFFLFP